MKKVLIIVIILILVLGGFLWWNKNHDFPAQNLWNLGFNNQPVSDQQQNQNVEQLEPKFVNLGPAPELDGATKWLNLPPETTDVKMADQLGKVVLVHFWTYSSFHSIEYIDQLKKWLEQYGNNGLVVISVHTPQFTFEKVTSNLESSVKRYGITYPIAQDNNYKIWNAYNNQFWPATYLVDKNGTIVYTHFGDTGNLPTEKAIRKILGLDGEFSTPEPQQNNASTPDIYLGLSRLKNFGGSETASEQTQIFTFPKKIPKNNFALEGKWKFTPEALVHDGDFGRIRLNFSAQNIFIVAQSPEPSTLKIYIDGKLQKGVTINDSNIYPLSIEGDASNKILELEVSKPGLEIYSFTFN